MTKVELRIQKALNLNYKNIPMNSALKIIHTVTLTKFGILSQF